MFRLLYLFLLLTHYAALYSTTYGFGPGLSGLAYLGLGVGFILATLFGARIGNGIYHKVWSSSFPPMPIPHYQAHSSQPKGVAEPRRK